MEDADKCWTLEDVDKNITNRLVQSKYLKVGFSERFLLNSKVKIFNLFPFILQSSVKFLLFMLQSLHLLPEVVKSLFGFYLKLKQVHKVIT